MGKIAKFLIASAENNFRPPALSYKAFLLYGIILLLLRLFIGAIPASSAAVESSALMTLINQERQLRNFTVLTTHASLLAASAGKSQDMIDRDYFAHIDPDGNYVWGRIINAGYSPYKILGENLAIDFATSEGIIRAWLDSPTHRTNLLHPEFQDQGLTALYGDYNGRYTNVTTSLFGTLLVPQPEPPLPLEEQPPAPDVQAEVKEQATEQEVSETPLPESKAPVEEVSPPIVPRRAEPSLQQPPLPPPEPRVQVSLFQISRAIFTLFGIVLLIILAIDSIIIYRHELKIGRSHPTYHLFGFTLIVLLSILIWWW